MIVIIVELLGDRFSAGHYVQLACLQGEAREGLIYHYVTWSHELPNIICAHMRCAITAACRPFTTNYYCQQVKNTS